MSIKTNELTCKWYFIVLKDVNFCKCMRLDIYYAINYMNEEMKQSIRQLVQVFKRGGVRVY